MLKNYFKTAWRNLVNNKAHSFINITGLSVGMAVAMLIGLWIYDEVSFNKSFANYNRIGKLWQFVSFSSEKSSYNVMPIPLANELRTKYADFRYVSLSVDQRQIFASGEKKLSETGFYVQPDFTKMMQPKMIEGNRDALTDMHSILLSRSLAKSLYGSESAINKLIRINNKLDVKVAGVYDDFATNSEFKDAQFLGAWDLYMNSEQWVKDSEHVWDNNSWQIYGQLNAGADFGVVSAKIKDIRMKMDNPPKYKPEFFIHPMSKWHLYNDFQNGVNTGGIITFVWLFGIIGAFVLLLACINFMNLSTARSEKRAREVGIRKAVGSVRRQLIFQFLSESLLVSLCAFIFSMLIASLVLPFFNQIADKQLKILWNEPLFWIIGFAFSFFTGLVAGSYPALYLSSFRPVKVLKGTFKAGRFASIPRKVLVTLQFTVSVTLIIGTIVIFRQIQFVKNISTGYNKGGLIEINMNTPDLIGHYDALRNDLLQTKAVFDMAEAGGSMTEQGGGTTDMWWKGKDPNTRPLMMSNAVTHDYGRTIGWQITQGRDFSRNFATDSSAIILNEAAVKFIGFKNPIGETFKTGGRTYTVVGVAKDMIKESPFSMVKPSFFTLNYHGVGMILLKLSPELGTSRALSKVETVFKKYNPSSPFEYSFVDELYGRKFSSEERIGKLAGFFSVLAILISCLGLFGLASFIAEQRTKEIGVRKVLGASVFNLWKLLSKEFVLLVILSLLIATPIAWWFMNKWLQNYDIRTTLSWWIFAAAGTGALLITIATVSFHSIRAAMANPVKSLRSE
ncbi:MAG: ABC transporter permease [Bacteroidetes bacterium]|nr:ABC transporter permease [Bacteroidota bacterium]